MLGLEIMAIWGMGALTGFCFGRIARPQLPPDRQDAPEPSEESMQRFERIMAGKAALERETIRPLDRIN